MNLMVVAAYLRKLTENTRITKYLGQHHPEIQVEFQKLVEAKNLMESQQH
ncbi:MAG: hypothetical protein U0791_25110 [Gemmataceae bacterium]